MRQYTKTYRITITENQAEKLAEIRRKYRVVPSKIIRKAIEKVLSDYKIKSTKQNIKVPF